jgi:hypothetical protein
MGALTALSFGMVGFCLAKLLSNKWVALLGFLATVFNAWLCFVYIAPAMSLPFLDVYFQYHPIRLLFPACSVLLAWTYLARPSRGLYWISLGLLAAGVLWNIDSGVPAFLSWVGLVCFAEVAERGWPSGLRKSALHLVAACLSFTAVVVAWSVGMRLLYGAFPDYASAIRYQQLFYLAGFCMLPMPLPGTWMVVVLIYLAGLMRAFMALAAGRCTIRARMAFYFSLLGVGLFAYFQGRSAKAVLTLAWWPCFPLMALFLDELLDHFKGRAPRPLAAVAALLLLWFLAGSSWSLFAGSQFLRSSIEAQFALAALPGSPLAEEVLLLKAATPPGVSALVISYHDGLVHLHSGVPSLARSSINQLLLIEDYADICEALETSPTSPVFIGNEIATDFVLSSTHNLGIKRLMVMIQAKYRVTARSRYGCIYQRAEQSASLPADFPGHP